MEDIPSFVLTAVYPQRSTVTRDRSEGEILSEKPTRAKLLVSYGVSGLFVNQSTIAISHCNFLIPDCLDRWNCSQL